MMTLAVRLLVWGHRLGDEPVYRLGGAVLGAALGLDPHGVYRGLIGPALGRLVRAQERSQFSSPKDQEDLADVIAQLKRLENP